MKPRLEWKVGLFVLISLALLGGLLLQFSKGTSLFHPTYTIRLHTANISGLKARAWVLMAGVQVGSVADIELSPDGKNVTLSLKIYSEFKVYKDARFVIEQSGFLGDQYVAILPTANQGAPFTDGESAEAQAPFNLQEVARSASGFIQRVDETAKRLNNTIDDVRRLLLNEQTLTNLAVSVGNLRTASERGLSAVDRIDLMLSTNGPSIAEAASNVVVFSQELNQFAAALSGVLASNSPEIRTSVQNIEASTASLKRLMAGVEAGEGLAGQLVRNSALSTNVAEITHNLSVTTSNLNSLGLWGVLRQPKPPKTPKPAKPTSSAVAAPPLTAPKNPFD